LRGIPSISSEGCPLLNQHLAKTKSSRLDVCERRSIEVLASEQTFVETRNRLSLIVELLIAISPPNI
jgi:hypothetical protein